MPALLAYHDIDVARSLEEVKWEHIHRVLLQCRGNIRMAAKKLGLHQRTLQRKLAKLGRSKSPAAGSHALL